MSRAYEMAIEVTGIARGRKKQVKKAVRSQWNVEATGGKGRDAFMAGEGSLCGGESETEFSERLARSVWQANGDYCEVLVRATSLEELPYETHYFGRGDYKKMGRRDHA